MKILIVVWARPNFMKVAPIISEFKKYSFIEYKLIHTWQHFDKNMSDTFFEDLWLPYPDINLNINWWSVSDQIWKIMINFDIVIKNELPDFVLVVWDVNSTIACSIVSKQNWVKLIHIESWLRSFDEKMPEEINRILTDRISDFLFVTEKSWINNLKNEWIEKWVYLVWNVMIDSLINNLEKINQKNTYLKLNLEKDNYWIITIHRPSNVDQKENLEYMLKYFVNLSNKIKLVLPLHPRTKANIEKFWFLSYLDSKNIIVTEPLAYTNFINLLMNSKFILTDSWWAQEESTFLHIPCLTMRYNTERPITCEIWTSELVWNDFTKIDFFINQIMNWTYKKWKIPDFWDWKASNRILKVLLENK